VGPSRWKARKLEEILANERIVDFDARDEMTFAFLKKHRLEYPTHPERHLVNNTDALAMMIASGHGYSVLSQDFASSLVRSKQMVDLAPGKTLKLDFALAWYPRKEMPAYFRSIIRAIR
jgi:DNA-binding transcriptional LysR family regulator